MNRPSVTNEACIKITAPTQTIMVQVPCKPHPDWHTPHCTVVMFVQCNYALEKGGTTLTELKYWIFICSRRPGRACSILAWGGHTIKGDKSRKVSSFDCPEKQKAGAGGEWTHTPTSMHTRACIHKCIHTYTAEDPHIPILILPAPPSSSLQQKADAIYMSWREVTGSNQSGE